MRLLNTKTYHLEEFYGAGIPKYAILSHTWEKEEVTFQDIHQNSLDVIKRSKPTAWSKVENACIYACKYDFKWIWIDSCCINKESSAELSEAINSMYQYYEDSGVCYAWLPDASRKDNPRSIDSKFKDCRWFKRGWTLQELLAPRYVTFLDKDWLEIGTRWTLRDVVSVITSIPVSVFEDGDIYKFSIAQRMSWAALRETTRPEDQAYCLMGIFGVSMPPIYGEGGAKAFMRLQQELIKISDDRSIFAWLAPPRSGKDEHRGLFARSPFEFRMSGEVGISESDDISADKSSYYFANNGIYIHLPLEPAPSNIQFNGELFLASLNCRSRENGSYVSVYLLKTSGQRYIRYHASEILFTRKIPAPDLQELVVKEKPLPYKVKEAQYTLEDSAGFSIELSPHARRSFDYLGGSLSPRRDQPHWVLHQTEMEWVLFPKRSLFASFNYVTRATGEFISLVLGFIDNVPCYNIYNRDAEPTSDTHWQLEDIIPQELRFRADRISVPLKSGRTTVSLSINTTGGESSSDTRILCVDCVDGTDATSSVPKPMETPRLGFTVPSVIHLVVPEYYQYEYALSLIGVFPPDFFFKECGSETYLSMPQTGESSENLRILTYILSEKADKMGSSSGEFITVHVALGIHGSTAWTDILSIENHRLNQETSEMIWRSYALNSGLRAHHQQKHQRSASVLASWVAQLSFNITVAIKERTNLQLGSHSLSMNFEPHLPRRKRI
ncbi:hypothetical protein VKT23_007942 [Stygiomarasmius scandens]|uniref:Heterokaryon incompatibility domain-containing protein n=1 Tax=Marasmiellus scandens TaxID=2682957 RepID=A0ABR1JJT2_9AGAR